MFLLLCFNFFFLGSFLIVFLPFSIKMFYLGQCIGITKFWKLSHCFLVLLDKTFVLNDANERTITSTFFIKK